MGQENLRSKKVVALGQYNVASLDWFCRALAGSEPRTQLLEFSPRDMLCCTKELEQEFARKFDLFGDSYTVHGSREHYTEFLDRMDLKVF